MSASSAEPMVSRWTRFIHDYERTKHEWTVVFALAAVPLAHMHLTNLLPSFLYVQAVSVLDDGFKHVIAEEYQEEWPKKKQPTFGNRIDFLMRKRRLADADACRGLKDRRNELGHELYAYVDWAELDMAIRAVERELQHVGLVGDRPCFNFTTSVTPSS